MKTELIHTLNGTFEAHAQQTPGSSTGWRVTCNTCSATLNGAISVAP